MAYRYRIQRCDVSDIELLKEYRKKRSEWLKILAGKDPNSIWNQFHGMMWLDANFRMLNEARGLSRAKRGSACGINPGLLQLLTNGYVSSQTSSIRRLVEYPPNDPNKAVYSLKRVLNDIRNHLHLITRQNYVCYDGLPYDPTPKGIKFSSSSTSTPQIYRPPTTGKRAWMSSEITHRQFDRLSRIEPSRRTREDQVSSKLIDYFNNKLKPCSIITKFTHKFIAHAADPQTRRGLTEAQKRVTLDRLGRCHKAIFQVTTFIHHNLLNEGYRDAIRTPQMTHLQNLDKKWISTKDLKQLYDFWDGRKNETDNWANFSWPKKL